MRILLGARGKNQKNPTIIIKLNQMSKITDEQLEKLHKQQTALNSFCLLYTSPSPRDRTRSRMPSSA